MSGKFNDVNLDEWSLLELEHLKRKVQKKIDYWGTESGKQYRIM
jgi:hypothetical protein